MFKSLPQPGEYLLDLTLGAWGASSGVGSVEAGVRSSQRVPIHASAPALGLQEAVASTAQS